MSTDGPNSSADDWDFYFCKVNDVPSSIMVNLSAIRRAPVKDKPWLLWAWVHMVDARPNGLSSDAEAPRLHEIEDALTKVLEWPCRAELLGRITGGGRREFYCYGPTAKGFETAIERVQSLFPAYRIDYGSKRDEGWTQYLQLLYPTESQMQTIQNRRVIKQLEEHGDDHSVPRIVDHALYFRTASERADFVMAAAGSGFDVHAEEANGPHERPFFVNLTRTDPVTLDHINEVVADLIELAARFDGDYDGWGCEVQRPAR